MEDKHEEKTVPYIFGDCSLLGSNAAEERKNLMKTTRKWFPLHEGEQAPLKSNVVFLTAIS